MGRRERKADAGHAHVSAALLDLHAEVTSCLRAVVELQRGALECRPSLRGGVADIRNLLHEHRHLMDLLRVVNVSLIRSHRSAAVELFEESTAETVEPQDPIAKPVTAPSREVTRLTRSLDTDKIVTPFAAVHLTALGSELETHEHVRFGRTTLIDVIQSWAERTQREDNQNNREAALQAISSMTAQSENLLAFDLFSRNNEDPFALDIISYERHRFGLILDQVCLGWGLESADLHGLVFGNLTFLARSGTEISPNHLPAEIESHEDFPSFFTVEMNHRRVALDGHSLAGKDEFLTPHSAPGRADPAASSADPKYVTLGQESCDRVNLESLGFANGFSFNFRARVRWGLLSVVSRQPLSKDDRISLAHVATTLGHLIEHTFYNNRERFDAMMDRKTGRANEAHLYSALQRLCDDATSGILALISMDDSLKYSEELDTSERSQLMTLLVDDLYGSFREHTGRLVCGTVTDSILFVLCEMPSVDEATQAEFIRKISKVTSERRTRNLELLFQPRFFVGADVFQQHEDPEAIVKRVYSALDFASGKGAPSVAWGHQEATRNKSKRLALQREFQEAIENGQLVSYFQPEVSLLNRMVTSFESLIRWRHPERGLIGPGDFIPAAESSGLIVKSDLDRLLYSIRTAVEWGLADYGPEMRVNLSPVTLHTPGLAQKILALCEQVGIATRQLVVEVTETAIISDQELAVAELQELRRSGVGVALDDFGVGESSLARLRTLPISIVKLDRQFVAPLPGDKADRAFVEAVRTLIRSIDLEITAEGVETTAQLEALVDAGVERAQGFLFSRPLPPEEAVKLLPSRIG